MIIGVNTTTTAALTPFTAVDAAKAVTKAARISLWWLRGRRHMGRRLDGTGAQKTAYRASRAGVGDPSSEHCLGRFGGANNYVQGLLNDQGYCNGGQFSSEPRRSIRIKSVTSGLEAADYDGLLMLAGPGSKIRFTNRFCGASI